MFYIIDIITLFSLIVNNFFQKTETYIKNVSVFWI